jgi:propanol-preferring alcohol dehydrogenase
MHAAVVHGFDKPLSYETVATPIPAAGQVLVRIEASGLCHTDIHAAHGDWPVKPSPPFIPGHEGVGVVQQVGGGVHRFEPGARVAVPWLGWACGECEACVSGWETLCDRQRNVGYSVNGCHAEYVCAEAAFVGIVPANVSAFEAAPLTCAGVTTYKAVKVSGARSSDLVAVFGVGGLGHLAVQYARIAGATVVAIDVTEDKLSMAKQLGAEYTINAAREDVAAAVQRLGGADAAIATAATPKAFEHAFRSLRRGGRLVFVGLPAENVMHVPIFETVLNGLSLHGSIVGTRLDLAEVFELHSAGLTKVVYETRQLAEINDAIHDVESGAVPARIVLIP